MAKIQTDILISGGGVAGLTAAAAFGAAGFKVICVDPTPPVTNATSQTSDLRSTAFLQPARELLKDAGLWDRLSPHAAPLQIMRIVDAGGEVPTPRLIKNFNAADISDLPFGWNLPNWLLRREMVAHLQTMENVEFRAGVSTKRLLTRDGAALVSLSDKTQVRARLLIAADGRNSPMREALGIDVKTMRYGQKALAFCVTHPLPHENVSTEIHRSGGPFTLVPLPDQDGKHCSAIVWMERGPEAKRLAHLDVAEFETEMNRRSCEILGPLTLTSRRSVWPIISQIADKMVGERTALIAEAAHVVPPIGAQGLNMSLGDMRVLLELANANPDDLGSVKMLQTYQRRRHTEIKARIAGVNALNRASMISNQALRDVRAKMLDAFYSAAPIRKNLMRAGLGTR